MKNNILLFFFITTILSVGIISFFYSTDDSKIYGQPLDYDTLVKMGEVMIAYPKFIACMLEKPFVEDIEYLLSNGEKKFMKYCKDKNDDLDINDGLDLDKKKIVSAVCKVVLSEYSEMIQTFKEDEAKFDQEYCQQKDEKFTLKIYYSEECDEIKDTISSASSNNIEKD